MRIILLSPVWGSRKHIKPSPLLLLQWKNLMWVSVITWHQVEKGILLWRGALWQCLVNFWGTEMSLGSEDFWDSHAATTCNSWVAESTLFSRNRKIKDISCCMELCFPRTLFTIYLSLAELGNLGSHSFWANTENAWPWHCPQFYGLVTNI